MNPTPTPSAQPPRREPPLHEELADIVQQLRAMRHDTAPDTDTALPRRRPIERVS